MGWLVWGLEFEHSAIVVTGFTGPALTARSAGGDGDGELSLTFCMKNACPCLPCLQLSPCLLHQCRSGEGSGAASWDGMGDEESCDVGDHLSPGTTVPFTLAHSNSSRRKGKSVPDNDAKPHSLLILSFFSFLSSGFPSSSPTVLESIKAAVAPPS